MTRLPSCQHHGRPDEQTPLWNRHLVAIPPFCRLPSVVPTIIIKRITYSTRVIRRRCKEKRKVELWGSWWRWWGGVGGGLHTVAHGASASSFFFFFEVRAIKKKKVKTPPPEEPPGQWEAVQQTFMCPPKTLEHPLVLGGSRSVLNMRR